MKTAKPPRLRNDESFPYLLERELYKILELPDGTKTRKKHDLVAMLVEKARGGDLRAVELILNRMEGTPYQSINIESNNKHEISQGASDVFRFLIVDKMENDCSQSPENNPNS